MQSVIEVKDLKREYITTKGWIHRKKEFIQAVDGITFDVKQGEIFGLLGQNGAGKTTTIKMLITLLAPSSGSCKVLGYDTFGQKLEKELILSLAEKWVFTVDYLLEIICGTLQIYTILILTNRINKLIKY